MPRSIFKVDLLRIPLPLLVHCTASAIEFVYNSAGIREGFSAISLSIEVSVIEAKYFLKSGGGGLCTA